MQFKINVKINVKEFIPTKILPRCGSYKELTTLEEGDTLVLSSIRCRQVILPNRIYLSADDFVAIGLYLAEGTTYFNLDRKYNHDGEVSLVNSHPKCINIFCNLLTKFNVNVNKLKWKVGLNINYKDSTAQQTIINYWINEVGLDKTNLRPTWLYYSGKIGSRITSNTGRMGCLHLFYTSTIFRNYFLSFINNLFEDAIKTKSKEKLALILKGLFAGDGCVSYSAKFKREQVEFLCNDSVLLENIRKSLEILGLRSIRETWPESTKTHTKALRIYNRHDFLVLADYDIPNLLAYKRQNFQKILGTFEV